MIAKQSEASRTGKQAMLSTLHLLTLAEMPVMRMRKSERLGTSKTIVEDDQSRKQCKRTEQASKPSQSLQGLFRKYPFALRLQH